MSRVPPLDLHDVLSGIHTVHPTRVPALCGATLVYRIPLSEHFGLIVIYFRLFFFFLLLMRLTFPRLRRHTNQQRRVAAR